MTVSTMPCCKSARPDGFCRLLRAFLALALVCVCIGASAGGIEPTRAALVATDEGYALSAEFNVDLGPRVEEAVTRGIALYFNLEFELTRDRWYWANEHMVSHTLTYRLSYTPLTRQYRLATGSLFRSFDTLSEALRALGRVGALPVMERGAIKPGERYMAAVRLGLDRNQLPKPFQLDAFANRDWDIPAKVLRWQPAFPAAGEGK